MEEIFEDGVLDDLFKIRTDEFERSFIKKYGKPKEIEELENAEIELERIIKELVIDEKIQGQILKIIEEYTSYRYCELYFWNKEYYKFGVIDGMSIKKEMSKLIL